MEPITPIQKRRLIAASKVVAVRMMFYGLADEANVFCEARYDEVVESADDGGNQAWRDQLWGYFERMPSDEIAVTLTHLQDDIVRTVTEELFTS